jgi:dTDP-4-dehydrorhamnose reductase
VNAAAYTAVDKAETEDALAMGINREAPGVLAEEAKRLGALLLHFSTDYVFDGSKTAPYVESDAANPQSVYGKSKLAGEEAVRASGCRHTILRSAWIYSGHGSNFALTILRKARELPRLRVVADQRGAPTWARDLAELTASLLARGDSPEGTYHAAAAGETTWHRYAVELLRLAGIATPVDPIATADYPVAARRPAYSVLDSGLLARVAGARIGDWRERLSAFMAGMVKSA